MQAALRHAGYCEDTEPDGPHYSTRELSAALTTMTRCYAAYLGHNTMTRPSMPASSQAEHSEYSEKQGTTAEILFS